jgi:hypothetical protein
MTEVGDRSFEMLKSAAAVDQRIPSHPPEDGGFRVNEIKVNNRLRTFGKTKCNIRKRIFMSFVDLLAVRWMKKRQVEYEIEEVIG